jgi:hypothetical protein
MKNKLKLNLVISIILVILVAVGLIYISFNNSKHKKEENVPNLNNLPIEDLSMVVYKNTFAGYSIKYSKNWEIVNQKTCTSIQSTIDNRDVIGIAKIDGEYLHNSKFPLMYIYVDFSPNQQGNARDSNNKDKTFLDYKTIDDYIKDYDGSNKQNDVYFEQNDLRNVTSMNIGGKLLRVKASKKIPDSSPTVRDEYKFIYKDKLYSIYFSSANENQYYADQQVFDNLLSSFVLLDENLLNINSLPIQDGSVKTYKSVYAGYSTKYPLNWEMSEQKTCTSIEAIMGDSDYFVIYNDKSSISVNVNFSPSVYLMNNLASINENRNKTFSDYKTIDDYIKDSKTNGQEEQRIQQELKNISSINIGGKILRVRVLKKISDSIDTIGDNYEFIYKDKLYNLFYSTSEDQYLLDHKVFDNLLSSFVFL